MATGDPAVPDRRVARLVTEAFAPAVWAATMPLVIALYAGPTPAAGLAYGLLAVLFCAAVPYAVIWIGVRRGRLTDHHISRREQRRTPLLIALISVAVGLVLLRLAGAPAELIAMVAAALMAGVGVTVANQFWKMSAHTAVAAGSVAVLVMVFGPVLLAGYTLVVLVGWSRVALGAHTTAQVLVGATVGTALSAVTFGLLA